ncbi:hypothetical protein RN001_015291 [Aquatica leii]|uniref:Cuticle protein n=1 Tax=Aquatica leii TaxID=1421715 RepID=A0AAN7PQL5_9COLE|nr:hypothetical protein RN001_015291 [Aquatica leii]
MTSKVYKIAGIQPLHHYLTVSCNSKMISKFVVLFAAIAFTNAGYLEPALRYAAPAIHSVPAISYAAPAISRVEHLAPAVASSYKTEVYTPSIARTYEIAPAVTHVAAAPAVHVAPAPLIARAPLVHAAPAISYAAPAISRIEHLAPAVASSYKTEVLTAPSARTYEIAPAVTHVAPAPLIARAPLVHAAPAFSLAQPAIHHASLLRAAPLHYGFNGHLSHGLGHLKYF